jgi:hypothetical protein
VVEAAPAPVADSQFQGLDNRYHPVLAALLEQKSWAKPAFDTLARQHGLMPSAILDVVNEWSQDRFDDLLIDEQPDAFAIHADLVSAAS